MTRSERTAHYDALHAIWRSLDFPPIPLHELNTVPPEALRNLLDFWRHQKRHWGEENPPVFRPSIEIADLQLSANYRFSKLTPRQLAALQKISVE